MFYFIKKEEVVIMFLEVILIPTSPLYAIGSCDLQIDFGSADYLYHHIFLQQ